jgi:hypothetical protein
MKHGEDDVKLLTQYGVRRLFNRIRHNHLMTTVAKGRSHTMSTPKTDLSLCRMTARQYEHA